MSNSNISSTCPYNAANFGPLTAEISLPVWGTPANFNRFRILLSLLQRHRSPEANQTLHGVWPSPGLVHYVYIFWAFCPDGILPGAKIHVTSKSYILVYWQHYCRALHLHASSKLCGVVQGGRGRHLYLAGWTSRWASAHILVDSGFSFLTLALSIHDIRKRDGMVTVIKNLQYSQGIELS